MPERRVSLKDLIVSVARRRRSIRVAVLVVREGGSWTLIVNTYVFFAFNVVPQPQPNRLVAMIRRNPTLIPMNDLDVQDIRDMVAKQKADQQLMQKMKRLVESPDILKEDYDLITELSKDKARRLGLDPDSAKS